MAHSTQMPFMLIVANITKNASQTLDEVNKAQQNRNRNQCLLNRIGFILYQGSSRVGYVQSVGLRWNSNVCFCGIRLCKYARIIGHLEHDRLNNKNSSVYIWWDVHRRTWWLYFSLSIASISWNVCDDVLSKWAEYILKPLNVLNSAKPTNHKFQEKKDKNK